jgi:hypothetical protein
MRRGVLLAALPLLPACATLAAASWAIAQQVGLDYAEPVIYSQALRLRLGEPLYQPIDQPPYTIAAYTPAFYALAALLQSTIGPGFAAGRVVSLASGLVAAALIALLAARRDSGGPGGPWLGAFAALLFLGLAFPGPLPWLGLYRVDLLGLALSLASVALLPRAVVPAGLLAGVALLTKQTFFAALLAGLASLWLVERRLAMLFAIAALLPVALTCAMLEWSTGGAFLQNTVAANINPFHPAIARDLLRTFVEAQWLPLLLASIYLAQRRPWRAADSRLLVLYWVAASLSLIGLGKVGANNNYWLELAAASTVLAARGVGWLLRHRAAWPALAALVVAFGIVIGGPSGALTTAREIRGHLKVPPADPDFVALVDLVRREPRAVIAEPMDVLALANRPVLLEPFVYNLLLDAGRWTPEPLLDRICRQDIGLLVLGYPLASAAKLTDGLYALWPAPVLATLAATMQLDQVTAGRYVYRPRGDCEPAQQHALS